MRKMLARVASTRVVRPVVSVCVAVATFLRYAVPGVGLALLGRVRWQPPDWITFTGAYVRNGWRYLTAKPVRAVTFFLVLLTASAAAGWWATRPRPQYVTFVVTPPGLTEYDD